jgi:hypothetical protein
VHRRYLNELTLNKMPDAAVPELDSVWAFALPKLSEPANETGLFSGGRSRDRTCDFDRVKTKKPVSGRNGPLQVSRIT